MAENFDPSPLEQLVSELNHDGKSQYIGLLFPVHTRLEPATFGMLEALTHHAGTSRNKLVNQLLDVGIAATLKALPGELVEKLTIQAQLAENKAIEKNAGSLERGEV